MGKLCEKYVENIGKRLKKYGKYRKIWGYGEKIGKISGKYGENIGKIYSVGGKRRNDLNVKVSKVSKLTFFVSKLSFFTHILGLC